MLHVLPYPPGSAMAVALDRIATECAPVSDVARSDLHRAAQHVRRVLREPDHPAVIARYTARARTLEGRSLDAASAEIDRQYRYALQAFRLASALGRGVRLPTEVLRELRVILRWLRLTKRQAVFPAVAAEIVRRAA